MELQIKNKKGNIIDVLFIIIASLAVIVGFVMFFYVWDNVTTGFSTSDGLPQITKDLISRDAANTPPMFDNVFSLLFFGAFFSIIAAAFFIQSSMAFFIVGVVMIGIFTFIAGLFSNIYQELVSSESGLYSFVTSNFSLSNHIMNHYPLYTGILGVILLISLFAKVQGSPSGGSP